MQFFKWQFYAGQMNSKENMMGKKLNALSNGEDQNLSDAIRASAQQIWQAGLGAFNVAEQEGGKLFSKLVKDGMDIEKRTRHLTGIKLHDVSESVSKMASNVNKQTTGSWEKIEKVFEDRVSKVLTQLGVLTSKDLHALSRRVEELSVQVAQLAQPAAKAAAPRKAAKKVVAARPAAKPATRPAAKRPVAKAVASKRA
jgi:poly(hydroxyalkanoate) granule-associated protein